MREDRIRIEFQGREVDAVRVNTNQAQEHWSTYLLDDGTTLRARITVLDVLRVLDHYDHEGNPVYVVKHHTLIDIRAPEELTKKKEM